VLALAVRSNSAVGAVPPRQYPVAAAAPSPWGQVELTQPRRRLRRRITTTEYPPAAPSAPPVPGRPPPARPATTLVVPSPAASSRRPPSCLSPPGTPTPRPPANQTVRSTVLHPARPICQSACGKPLHPHLHGGRCRRVGRRRARPGRRRLARVRRQWVGWQRLRWWEGRRDRHRTSVCGGMEHDECAAPAGVGPDLPAARDQSTGSGDPFSRGDLLTVALAAAGPRRVAPGGWHQACPRLGRRRGRRLACCQRRGPRRAGCWCRGLPVAARRAWGGRPVAARS